MRDTARGSLSEGEGKGRHDNPRESTPQAVLFKWRELDELSAALKCWSDSNLALCLGGNAFLATLDFMAFHSLSTLAGVCRTRLRLPLVARGYLPCLPSVSTFRRKSSASEICAAARIVAITVPALHACPATETAPPPDC